MRFINLGPPPHIIYQYYGSVNQRLRDFVWHKIFSHYPFPFRKSKTDSPRISKVRHMWPK